MVLPIYDQHYIKDKKCGCTILHRQDQITRD
jgi:hypothetical protein